MKRFLSLLISLLGVIGLTLHVEDAGWTIREPRSFLNLPLFILTAFCLDSIFNSKETRLKIFSFIPAAILSFCRLFGSILVKKQSALWLVKSPQTIFYGLLYWISGTVILCCLIFLCYRALSRVKIPGGNSAGLPFVLIWAALAAAWLPWFLNKYPAIMSADSVDTIEMALGLEPLTNHHPVFYTLLVKTALDIGRIISGPVSGNQTGIALFSILQFLGMTAVYAACLKAVLKTAPFRPIKIAAFLFFLFYPVHPLYSVTVWKDVPFSVCVMTLITFLILEMREHRISSCVGITVSGLLLALFRHNGLYLVILSIPFLPWGFKKHLKQTGLAFLTALLLFAGWRILLSARQIPDGQASEAFSIPLQQIALTSKRHHSVMDRETLEELSSFFSVSEIWERYSPQISDPVKNRFDDSLYKSDPGKFWNFWLRLGTLYPQDYLDGILLHTYGYWYPETPHWVFITGIDNDGSFGIRTDPKLNTAWTSAAGLWLLESGYDQIPLLSLLFSPGACFWLYVIALFYCLYRKSSAFFLLIPLFILWLTALASPVNCEFRYVYAMFSCLPLILSALPFGDPTGEAGPAV